MANILFRSKCGPKYVTSIELRTFKIIVFSTFMCMLQLNYNVKKEKILLILSPKEMEYTERYTDRND